MFENEPARLSYTVPQAAQAIGIGKTKLYALMKSGELPFVKIGQRTVIPRDGLLRLVTPTQRAA